MSQTLKATHTHMRMRARTHIHTHTSGWTMFLWSAQSWQIQAQRQAGGCQGLGEGPPWGQRSCRGPGGGGHTALAMCWTTRMAHLRQTPPQSCWRLSDHFLSPGRAPLLCPLLPSPPPAGSPSWGDGHVPRDPPHHSTGSQVSVRSGLGPRSLHGMAHPAVPPPLAWLSSPPAAPWPPRPPGQSLPSLSPPPTAGPAARIHRGR